MGGGDFRNAISESPGDTAATLDEADKGQLSFPAMQEVGKALGEASKSNPVPTEDKVTEGIDESEPGKVGPSLGEGGKEMDPFGNDTSPSPSPGRYPFDQEALRVAALRYLDRVKNETFYPAEPEVFNDFLCIMAAFKDGRLDTQEVIDQVEELFAGNYTLLEGFNTFLPPGYHCGRGEWHFP